MLAGLGVLAPVEQHAREPDLRGFLIAVGLQRHRIGFEREDDFNVRNLSDIAEAATTTARVFSGRRPSQSFCL